MFIHCLCMKKKVDILFKRILNEIETALLKTSFMTES